MESESTNHSQKIKLAGASNKNSSLNLNIFAKQAHKNLNIYSLQVKYRHQAIRKKQKESTIFSHHQETNHLDFSSIPIIFQASSTEIS
jgi:hypothetical protein